MEKDPKSPATTSLAYDSMKQSWDKVQSVLDGTETLRQRSRLYLPQHANEADAAYEERLKRNTLFNLTKLTLDSWVGRPFSDPVKLADVPSMMLSIMDDVDMQGNNIQVVARNWFSDGLAKAYSHMYVDFPRLPTADLPRSLADDDTNGLRPYWIHIRPEQLIFADAELIAGKEVLREIRYMEEVVERVGFAEVNIPQIRRVFMDNGVGNVEIYREKPNKKKEEWIVVDRYTFDLDRIPLVTFYANRDSFMHGKSPLEDLADLNIAHWQSASDQRAVLTVARFPILALSGGTDDNSQLTIGPNRWLYSPDAQAKFYYVEHSGAAINAGRQDLTDLEQQMAEYGAEFLKKRPGGETATARALDSAEATSTLQDMTLRFIDALNQALQFTAMWMKQPSGGTVELTTEFGPEEINQAELSTLSETRKMRDLSRVAYLGELKRRGLLDEEFDIDADAAMIEQETMDMFGAVPVSENGDEGA